MMKDQLSPTAILNQNDVNVTWVYRIFQRPTMKKVFKVLFPILKALFITLVFLILYWCVFLIALQSINSSSDPSSFGHITFKWYTEIFKYRALRSAIFNTFIVAILTVIITTIMGTLFAIGLHALERKRRQRLILLNNIPLVNAEIVTGISLMLLFSLLLPLIPNVFGLPTMLIAHVFFTLPYVVLSVLPKLSEIDKNLYDASLDLGDRPIKSILKIIVPAILPGIISGMMFAFTMSIDDFVISYYTTGNGFDNVSIWIYSSIGKTSLKPAVYAYSTTVTFIAVAGLLGSMLLSKKKQKGKKVTK